MGVGRFQHPKVNAELFSKKRVLPPLALPAVSKPQFSPWHNHGGDNACELLSHLAGGFGIDR